MVDWPIDDLNELRKNIRIVNKELASAAPKSKKMKVDPMQFISMILTFFWVTSCAILHHAQIGEIDNRNIYKRKKIEVKVSEAGVNLKELGQIARRIAPREGGEIDKALEWVRYFQMGPRTGNPVYNEKYARNLYHQIRKMCPSGHISGLVIVRENRKYPVISGEIVKITADCLIPKKG